MGSQPRLIADGLVYHALKRGNNRARVFFDDADFQQFLHALAQTKERYPFRLFAYCLMDNHYHLVLEPAAGQSISRILQSLTVAHIWHYHKAAASSGHVWQGRFKSPVVSADEHLLRVMRYVESNPLRAGMVRDLAGYRWSSYLVHGLGQRWPLVDEVSLWASLANTEEARQRYWRDWLHTPLTEKELAAVGRSVTSGRPYGPAAWVEQTAAQLGLDLVPRRRGRPRKMAEKMNCSENYPWTRRKISFTVFGKTAYTSSRPTIHAVIRPPVPAVAE
jgi:putative transposase